MKTLVMYFSPTKTTQRQALAIAQKLGADTFEITAHKPYTSADLNWHDAKSRANREQEDAKARPKLGQALPDISGYDLVVLGHPTWWGKPPRIIQTVLESLDLHDKTLATFATSGGSTYAQTQALMKQVAVKKLIAGDVLNSQESLKNWLQKLENEVPN